MGKFFKVVLGAAFLPVAIGFSKVFYLELSGRNFMTPNANYFIWGAVGYMIMHILFYKPVYVYTLGHEIVHVLATWMCGGHITSFNVSSSGGSVSASKTNFFIELSPYFVPVYTMALILIFPLIKGKLMEWSGTPLYVFITGFTLGMHLVMNADVMRQKQTDIMRSGYMFSLVFIYIANLMIIFGLIALMAKGLAFREFFVKSLGSARDVYAGLWGLVSRGR